MLNALAVEDYST